MLDSLNENAFISDLELRKVVEATPECIKIVAPDGSLTFMNQAGLSMVEATSLKQVEGSCIFDVIAPEHRERWIEHHGRVCRGESLTWQFEITGLNGARRYMETHAVPLRNSAEGFSQLAVTRDITQRREAEAALKRNQIVLEGQNRALELAVHGVKLEDILDVLTITIEQHSKSKVLASILLTDKNGTRLFHGSAPSLPAAYSKEINGQPVGPNSGSCGTAAFRKEEVVVTNISEDPLWSEYKALAEQHGLKACYSSPIYGSSEVLGTFALYYLSCQSPGPDERKAVELLSRTAGIIIERFRETEQRKLTEEALAESEKRFRAMADNIPNLAWMADADGYIFWYNKKWYDYTGATPEQMEGWGWQSVHDEQFLPEVLEKWQESLDIGQPFEMVFPLRGSDGTFRPFLTRVLPVRDENGIIVNWFGTNTDVTTQKQEEEKLEQLVRERTGQLERSNQELLQFAHVASHDLKEPLRKIQTFADRLQTEFGDTLTPDATTYIQKINAASERMSNMVAGVLSYSQVNSEEQEIEPVDLGMILKNIENDLEVLFQETGARISYGQLPTIEGAPVLLHQLFYNLINNSIKFRRDDVSPFIEVEAEVQEGDSVVLIVKDNGIGFDEQFGEMIFNTFSRLHPKDRYEGTGLGLALCKRIVDRHGGKIWAKGKNGYGAEFYITLPVVHGS